MKLKNKIFKMTMKDTKAAKAERRKAARVARDEMRMEAARQFIKSELGIDVLIKSTSRDFYIVGEYPAKLEKELDKLLVKALYGRSVETLELPKDASLKEVFAACQGD